MQQELSTPDGPDLRLTPTSYVVLGLVDLLGPASPYRLKQVMQRSVADFHPVPHTTFYVEPARLARTGYLDESQEQSGRRRKAYALTEKGRRALADWLADPTVEPTQIRSPAMLKIFFGADPVPLARAALPYHEGLLAYFEALRERTGSELAEGPRLALETGIDHHRFWIAQWQRLRDAAAGRSPDPTDRGTAP